MAALMQCARFCAPSVHILKLVRITNSGLRESTIGTYFQTKQTSDQRSWHSAVAAQAQLPDSKVDNMMSTVERYLQQFGRISRKQLDPIVSHLDKEGSVNSHTSLSLLRLYGTILFDEPPSTRLRLAEELWGKFKKYGVTLDVTHYNTLLSLYIQNKHKFSPSEFLANMESSGVKPNRVTYQRLIACFCEEGDIIHASQILEHMKSASLPISDLVFNSFITGHLRANDPESAINILDVMRQAGLEATSATYQALAVGFAEYGQIDNVKKYIKQAEIENVPLRSGQILEVYATLATSGHSQHLKEVASFLHSGIPFNQDAVRVCNQLIAAGFDAAAYELFLHMPKPANLDANHTTLGRFFLRALARHERPVEKVVEIVRDMQSKQINKDDLSAVAHLAYLEHKPEYALQILEKLESEGLAIRPHYFWPAFIQFKNNNNKNAIYKTVEKLITLTDSRDEFVHTLHSYCIPALFATGESQDTIITRLQECGLQKKEVNFAYFLFLLTSSSVQSAVKFLEGREMSAYQGPLRTCLTTSLKKENDWQNTLMILVILKSQSSLWHETAMDLTASVLKHIFINHDKFNMQEVFTFMKQNNLKILKHHHADLSPYMKGLPNQDLNDLVIDGDTANTEVATILSYFLGINPKETQPALTEDLTLQELQSLVEQNPNNKAFHKRLLIKACAVGDEMEAEKVRAKLESEGFVFNPFTLTQLAFLYAAHVKNEEKAMHYLNQLETMYPTHRNYLSVILKLSLLQVARGKVDEALQMLQNYVKKHKDVSQQFAHQEKYIKDIVKEGNDLAVVKKLMDTLQSCGYVSEQALLDVYIMKLLESDDFEKILQEIEAIVKAHRQLPESDRVLNYFIQREDPERLQKVVDLLTDLYGLNNVFHHLIADFIECGHIKKARKIVETPGLKANMQRLSYHCQSFIERNKIQELEIFVELTRNLFGIDRDNMLFHLIRGYVSQNAMDKATEVLLRYEEEMIQPSVRTLRFLARNLQQRNMPVPFDVPAETNLQAKSSPATELLQNLRAKSSPATELLTPLNPQHVRVMSPEAQLLLECLKAGEIEKVLSKIKMQNNQSTLSEVIDNFSQQTSIPGLQSVFEGLANLGDAETLKSLPGFKLSKTLRVSWKASIFKASINSGKARDIVEEMEVKADCGEYLNISSLQALQQKEHQLFDKIESLARKLLVEKNYHEPLAAFWAFYLYNDSPHADQILQDFPTLLKTFRISELSSLAVREQKEELLKYLLRMKLEKKHVAGVYSQLLNLYVNTANVEAIEKTCQQIQANGLSHADLRKTVWKRVENFLTSNGKLIPALSPQTKSSSSQA